MVAAEWGTGQVLWSMVWFFMFVIWIWLLIAVFGDIFRSRDLSGGGKALWSLFVLFLPFLGVFMYLIVRGQKMAENSMAEAQARDDMFKAAVRDAVATAPTGGGDPMGQLNALKAQGVIDDADYERMKAKIA